MTGSASGKNAQDDYDGPEEDSDCPVLEIMVPLRLIHCDEWSRGFLTFGINGGTIRECEKEVGNVSSPISGGVSISYKGRTFRLDAQPVVEMVIETVNKHPEVVKKLIDKFKKEKQG